MTNEQRAKHLIQKYGFAFEKIPKNEIIHLIDEEIEREIVGTHTESSDYIRLLCGYLYCLGDHSDVPLLEKVKYGIDFDVQCMIDIEWIDSLKNGGIEDKEEDIRPREEIIQSFISDYIDY